MKRKILIVLLSIVCTLCLAFGLTACGNSSSGTTDDGQNNKQTGNTNDGSSSSGDNTGSGSDDSGSSSGDSGTSGGSSSDDTEQGGEQSGSTGGNTEEAASLEYTLSGDNSSYIISGIGSVTSTTVTIPSTYNGLPVTTIADGAFKDNTVIVIIIIADSVTTIGENAFSGCTSLTTATIGSGVTTIGANAFLGCSALTSVTIPASVTSIGANAFKDCVKIVIVIILGNPAIGDGAFSGCTLISDITLSDELLAKLSDILSSVFGDSASIPEVKDSTGEVYHNYDGYSYNENGHWQVCTVCGDKTASESHTLDDNNICTVCGYKQLVPSENLAYTLSTDGTYYTVSGIGTCSDTDIVIPSTYEGKHVTAIAASAFKNQTQLTSVYVPDSVTSIGEGAFSGCSSLASMTLPFVGGSVKTSSDTYQYPFGYIFGTTSYTGGTKTTQYYYGSSTSSTTNTTYYIPATLTAITITGGNILRGAFYGCSSLTSIFIPNGVTSIGDWAFYNCTALESITIPDSVTSIGNYAFRNCTALIEINYNATAVKDLLDNNVFLCAGQSGDGITVTIGANVTKIPAYLFYSYSSSSSYAPNITNVVFEEGSQCTSIGRYTFYNCSSLTSIEIPKEVTSIGTYAFYYCTSLTEIKYNATAVDNLSFANYVFYCAGQSGDGITVTIGANVTKIPECLFLSLNNVKYVPKIRNVVFEEGSQCTKIGKYAFAYCTSLNSITIPAGVTSIGMCAFLQCDIKSIAFENTSGWYVSTSSTATNITTISSSDLSKTSTAAYYFTVTYCNYYWFRSES